MLQQNPHNDGDVLLGLQFSVIYTLKSQSLVHYMRKVHYIGKYLQSVIIQPVEALLNGHSRKQIAPL